ncbi:TPA: hypothetical protein DIC20_02715 [Candidatus Dependentiae bacterium]|nr:hypothetical protein [Candidatus Dependentiae bacterium]HCU00592.1 hypothetical protein [Candidatus Dependentiae bacterium]
MAQAKLRHMKPRKVVRESSKHSSRKFSIKKYKMSRRWWQFSTAGILVLLLAITIGVLLYNAKMSTSRIIGRHVEEMGQVFELINEKCGILDFEHDVNYVDFLTVGSFVGSEVGAMNLRNPQEWGGPYLQDNPTIQTKYYEIIRTNKGYFLVPGNGVKLSNGMVVGKDLIFDKETDINALIEDGTLLNKAGKPLAVAILTHR